MVVGAVLSGCTGSGGGGAAGLGPAWKGYSQAQATYGLAMGTAEGIRYQSDVVLVGGGPDSVVSASADRQTWTIKGGADHAQDLKVGSVMVLTTFAVGRVTALGHSGGNLVVTLAPVHLTDVFHDATFHVRQAIDPAALGARQISLPGGGESPVSLGGGSTTAKASPSPAATSPPASSASSPAALGAPGALPGYDLTRFVAPATGGAGGTLPPVNMGSRFRAASADWDNQLTADSGGLSLQAARKFDGARLFKFELTLETSQPTLSLDLAIAGSEVVSASVRLSGITGMTLDFFGGSKEGVSTNIHDKVDVPMMNCFPIPSASTGAALDVCETVTFIVDTAFSAKDSSLEGRGEYALGGGAIGFDYAAGGKPTIVQSHGGYVVSPMTDSLQGPSIGVNAVVLAVKERFSFGVGGTYNNLDGPYLDLIQTVGATKGSSLAIVPCRRVDLGINMRGGWDSPPSGVTNSIVNTGIPDSTGVVKIFGGTSVFPPLKACAG